MMQQTKGHTPSVSVTNTDIENFKRAFQAPSKKPKPRTTRTSNSTKGHCKEIDLTFKDQRYKQKKVFSCDICLSSFKAFTNLKEHLDIHLNSKNFKCPYCSYACRRERNLKSHIFTHKNEKPMKCPKCAYTCIHNFQLTAHLLLHEHDRPFTCSQCEASFKKEVGLKMHVLEHSNIYKYKCSVCSYVSNRFSDYRRHVPIHSKAKPIKCPHCSYTCVRQSRLRAHILVHLTKGVDLKTDPILCNQEILQCDFCNYLCTTKSALKKHKLKHNIPTKYNCKNCEFSCSKISSLKSHEKIHQSVNSTPSSSKKSTTLLPIPKESHTLHISSNQHNENMLTHHVETNIVESNSQVPLERYESKKSILSNVKQVSETLQIVDEGNKPIIDCDQSHTDLWGDISSAGDYSSLVFEYLSQNFVVTVLKDENGPVVNRCNIETNSTDNFKQNIDADDSHTVMNNESCLQIHSSNHNQQQSNTEVVLGQEQHFTNTSMKSELLLKFLQSSIQQSETTVVGPQLDDDHLPDPLLNSSETKANELCGKTYQDTKPDQGKVSQLPRNHSKSKMYHCKDCLFSCDFKSSLKKHVESRCSGKPFDCTKCNFSCKGVTQFKAHLLKHDEKSDLRCMLCKFTCKKKNILMKHKRDEHRNTERNMTLYQCELCPYQCKSLVGFQSHVDKHSGGQRFVCTLCNMTFPSLYKLKKHKIDHGTQSFIQCQLCDYWCLQQQQMTTHQLQHTLEYPFPCPQCDAKYKKADSLQVHILNAHERKHRFKCTFCSYVGNRAADFREHLMSHAGVKPNKCNVCSYSCIRSSQLIKHMKTHARDSESHKCSDKGKAGQASKNRTRSKNYACAFCNFICKQAKKLKAHFVQMHLDLPEDVLSLIDLSQIENIKDVGSNLIYMDNTS